MGEGLQLREAGVGQVDVFKRKRFELGHASERGEIGIGQRFAIHGKTAQGGDRFGSGNRLGRKQSVTLADGQGFQRQRAQVPMPGRCHFGTVEDDALELFQLQQVHGAGIGEHASVNEVAGSVLFFSSFFQRLETHVVIPCREDGLAIAAHAQTDAPLRREQKRGEAW